MIYQPKHSDTEYLEWIVFYSAKINCSRDGEDCFVTWWSSNTELSLQNSGWYPDYREALDVAITLEKAL